MPNSYFQTDTVDWRSLGYATRAQYENDANPSQRYSSENPYARYIADENSRERRINLQQQAQDWEANQQDLLQQRQFQLEDRAHEEEYNSPLHQAILNQQAGITSSSDGSSGIGFVSTSTPDAPAASQTPTPQSTVSPEANDTEKASAITGITTSSADTILNALNFATSAVRLPYELANLSGENNLLSLRGQQLSDDMKSSQENQDFARELFNRQSLAYYDDLSVRDARRLLSSVDDDGNQIMPSSADIDSLVDTVPENYRDYYKSKVDRYLSDSSLLSSAYDSIRNSRRLRAFNSFEGQVGFMQEYASLYYRGEISRMKASSASDEFNYSLQTILNGLNYSETVANEMAAKSTESTLSANNSITEQQVYSALNGPASSADLRVSQLNNARKVISERANSFQRGLSEVASYISHIDTLISEIENKSDLNSQDETTLCALKLSRSQAYTYGASQLDGFYKSLFNFNKTFRSYKSTRSMESTGNGYEFLPTGPAGIPETSTTFNSDYNWSVITFDDFISDPASSAAGSLSDVALKLLF